MKNKIIAILILSIFLVSIPIQGISAQGETPINGNKIQQKIQANIQTTFRFREKTRIRVNSCVNVDVEMDCEADDIGEKTFSIQITDTDGIGDLKLNMTCRQNGSELGVQSGQTIRNRNRFQVKNGFTIKIKANNSCNATLGYELSEEEALKSEWAYFNETANEWVTIESSYVDGMLIGKTDHFSVWTIISESPTIDFGISAFIIFSMLGVAGIFLFTKKKLNEK